VNGPAAKACSSWLREDPATAMPEGDRPAAG
jgi:hypothetical protein